MRIPSWLKYSAIALAILVLCAAGAVANFILIFSGAIFHLDVVYYLLFGWWTFVARTVGNVRINLGMLAVGFGAAAALVLVLQLLQTALASPNERTLQTTRRAVAGILGVLLMFAAGLAFAGVVQMAITLATATEPLVVNAAAFRR